MRRSGMSAAYLAKYMYAALDESEELAPLRQREDFRALLGRLKEACGVLPDTDSGPAGVV